MHGVIFSNARKRDHLATWNAHMDVKTQMIECPKTHPWLYEITQSDVWKTPSQIHGAFYQMQENPQTKPEGIYRSIKITHSDTWIHFIECMKSFIRVFEITLLATWNTEYMKLLPWIRGSTHSDIWSNQSNTLKYAIECIKYRIYETFKQIHKYSIECMKYSRVYEDAYLNIENHSFEYLEISIECLETSIWTREDVHLNSWIAVDSCVGSLKLVVDSCFRSTKLLVNSESETFIWTQSPLGCSCDATTPCGQ